MWDVQGGGRQPYVECPGRGGGEFSLGSERGMNISWNNSFT